MISIIAGTKKRTKINVPKNGVRPTSVLKRKSIFSILESFAKKKNINIYDKCCIMDLYAGTGSLGLEAISRGVGYAYFFEINSTVAENLKNNCLKVCNNSNFEINITDIINCNFKNVNKKISIVFIDPPYNNDPFEKILLKLSQSKILVNNAIIVIETSKKNSLSISADYLIFNERIYGKTKVYFLMKNV